MSERKKRKREKRKTERERTSERKKEGERQRKGKKAKREPFIRSQTHLIFRSLCDNVWHSISTLILSRLQIFAESASICCEITALIEITLKKIWNETKSKTPTTPKHIHPPSPTNSQFACMRSESVTKLWRTVVERLNRMLMLSFDPSKFQFSQLNYTQNLKERKKI